MGLISRVSSRTYRDTNHTNHVNSNFVNSKNIMRWKLQLSYNVISFSLILYFLANKLAKEDIKSDDIQHSKDIKSFAISIDSKITDIENSILQAKNNIDEIKKS